MSTADAMLADDMAGFYADPLGHVLYSYPWGQGVLVGREPDQWQADFLNEIGREVEKRGFDGVNAVAPILMATASGHGIGKSTITAWIIKWIMDTRPYAKGIVTANTADQLRTKTWAELGKWHKMSMTEHWFRYNTGKGSMSLTHVDQPESWRVDAQTCREENSEGFAGLHAANSTPFYIFDEASAVPDKIWEVAEGGTTDGEPMWFAFGNPTRNTGRFRECFRKHRHRWSTRQIDSRTVSITNKGRIQEWVDDYGEDSDFVKVRVRGVFPSASFKQFVSEADVDAAYGRFLRPEQFSFAPVVLGVDPAWSGDDEFVVWKRQGLFSEKLLVVEKNDNDVHMANVIARLEDQHGADAVHVDMGYGTGIVSAGAAMGRSWKLVNFASQSPDVGCLNMRAYMWREMRDWLKEGGAVPEDDVLRTDLTSPETVPRLDGKIQLESKEDMKKRGVPSPNRADALALTFAYPVVKHDAGRQAQAANWDYDPLA